MSTDVVCNGYWLKGLPGALPVGVNTEEQWGQNASGGGCWAATWTMPNLDPNFTYDCLATGAHVEVFENGTKTFDGKLDALDLETMVATAKGQVQYDTLLSLMDDGSGDLVTSTTPNKVIDRAVAAGWNVKRVDDFCGSGVGDVPYVQRITNLDTGAVTESTATYNTVGALLDEVALSVGMRWGVDADRVIVWYPDKTVADWILVPGTAVPGVTDPQFVTTIQGRYCYGYMEPRYAASGTPGLNYLVANGYLLYDTLEVVDQASLDLMGEVREAPVDITALGPITGDHFSPTGPAPTPSPGAIAAATKNFRGRLDLVKARVGWTNVLTPQWFQLLTPGGSPAPLHLLKAGDLVSIHGTLTPFNQLDFGGHRDVVVSIKKYEADSNVISLTPMAMTSRDFDAALRAAVASPGTKLPVDVVGGDTRWFSA